MTKKEKWKPQIGGKYYIIINSHVGGGVHKRIWEGNELDCSYYENLNCFKSKKEASWVKKMFGKAW